MKNHPVEHWPIFSDRAAGSRLCSCREYVCRMTWNESGGALTRVGLVAQEQGHHPDLSISWNRVTISITTHDAGNTVTAGDRKLAAAIDAMTAP